MPPEQERKRTNEENHGKAKTPDRNIDRASVTELPSLDAVACPCGLARRWLAGDQRFPGTVHLTEILESAKVHYHKHHTEVYVILSCEPGALMELDGVRQPIQVLSAICIPPGVRHRAIGRMTALIICTPDFDPDDEYFD